jgi:hypothetical protein
MRCLRCCTEACRAGVHRRLCLNSYSVQPPSEQLKSELVRDGQREPLVGPRRERVWSCRLWVYAGDPHRVYGAA